MPIRAPSDWRSELDSIVRAFSGAYLFGMPFLYTMEMWWLGASLPLAKLLGFVLVAAIANLGLNLVIGFEEEHGVMPVVDRAIEALAVGLVASFALLAILNRINPGDPLLGALGQVVIQAAPLSIGVSVANAIFRGDRRGGEGAPEGHEARDDASLPGGGGEGARATLADVGAAAIGATLIGLSIAPTAEVQALAVAMTTSDLLALIGFSLVVTYAIVFSSDFAGGRRGGRPLQQPLVETLVSYAVSLSLSFAALYLFDRIQPQAAPMDAVTQTVVLAFPGSVGAAAGRLAL